MVSLVKGRKTMVCPNVQRGCQAFPDKRDYNVQVGPATEIFHFQKSKERVIFLAQAKQTQNCPFKLTTGNGIIAKSIPKGFNSATQLLVDSARISNSNCNQLWHS